MISQVCFFAKQQFTWHIQVVRELLGSVLRGKCQVSQFFRRWTTEPWAAMLTLFWRGSGSVCGEGGGGDLLCYPDLLPSLQFSLDICSTSTRKQQSVKLSQIPQYSALKSRFRFNRPVPQFRPWFRDRGNHRALHLLMRRCMLPFAHWALDVVQRESTCTTK